MATFGEIVYSVLDLLKERVDDAYYTEEHIIFLASKIRATLLERKYRRTRNSTFTVQSQENTQTVCLDLEPEELLPMNCGGMWLKSVQEIPHTLGSFNPKASVVNDLLHSMVTFIPYERMPFVGYNKWLKNIIYAARSSDGHVYLRSDNPQFLYLEKMKLEAVFSDVEEAASLSCDDEGNKCDILSQEFPLQSDLIPSCIELVVQEIAGSRYAPEDKGNNAKDDFADAAVAGKTKTPAESQTRQRQNAEE